MCRTHFVLLSFTVLLAFWRSQLSAQSATDSSSRAVIEAHVAAFNAHDVDRMMRLVTDDVAWCSIAGDSMSTDVRGSGDLRAWLIGYFRSYPTVHSTLEDIMPLGSFVAIRERARWQSKSGVEKNQASIGVYEVRDGKIARVWYYPAVRDK